MTVKNLRSNTTPTNRLSRILDFGLNQIRNTKSESIFKEALGRTYYLLTDGKIVTFREWYQMQRPGYIVSGTKRGCESHQEMILID